MLQINFKIKKMWMIILLILVPILIYWPVLSHNFLYFWDDQWVVMNTYTQGGINIKNLVSVFVDFYHGQYAPFNELSYLILYQFVEYDSKCFHALSLVWHLANVLLVFCFIKKVLILSGQVRDIEQIRWIAFLTALIFSIHPVNVESVAWISASKILIYSFFYLCALLFYLQYLEKKNWNNYLYTLLFFCFSFFGKEQAVTLPLCLLLIDWFVKRSMIDKRVWMEKIPLFVLSLIFGLVTILSQEGGGNAPFYPFLQRVVLACYTLFEYLVKAIIPIKLSYIYPFPYQPEEQMPLYLLIYPLVLLFLFYFYYVFRKNRIVVFSVLFFIIHLLVTIHIIPISRFAIVADRYSYLSIVGTGLLLSYIVVTIYVKKMKNSALRLSFRVTLFSYLFLFGVYSHLYCQQWEDTDTLKSHVRKVLNSREEMILINKE